MTHHSGHSGSGAATALAFLIGAGAGVAAGLLFAPRDGRSTREQLKQKAQDARSKVREGVEREKEMVSDTVDSAKQAAREGKEAVVDAARSARSRANKTPTGGDMPAP